MKKAFLSIMLLMSGAVFAETVRLQTIYTDRCNDAITFYQLVAQKTNGALVFNVQCGPGGYGPGGTYLPNTIDGYVTVNAPYSNVVEMKTIYTDSCNTAVTFYQLVAQKTNGAIIFNVQCGPGGYAPGGSYLPSTVDGYINLNLNRLGY